MGSNSQSSSYIYNIDVGGTVIKPAFTIIHVIPGTDYSELESANASTPISVLISTIKSDINQGGISAELMITYSYTDESSGYLSSLNLFTSISLLPLSAYIHSSKFSFKDST